MVEGSQKNPIAKGVGAGVRERNGFPVSLLPRPVTPRDQPVAPNRACVLENAI